MPDPEPKRGFSKEAWGAIAAVTVAVISGAVTLATHFVPSPKPAAEPTAAAQPPSPAPVLNADAIAGQWAGSATAGGTTFRIETEIAPGCALHDKCGMISVSHVPCRGALFLNDVQQGDYEFRVDNFEAPSASACTAGAGEHFRLRPDGTLAYTTTYEPIARGVLTRQAR